MPTFAKLNEKIFSHWDIVESEKSTWFCFSVNFLANNKMKKVKKENEN